MCLGGGWGKVSQDQRSKGWLKEVGGITNVSMAKGREHFKERIVHSTQKSRRMRCEEKILGLE